MEVGISALMQGDGVLRTQNLKEKKKTFPIGFEAIEASRCQIENLVWYTLRCHANDIPGTPETSAS